MRFDLSKDREHIELLESIALKISTDPGNQYNRYPMFHSWNLTDFRFVGETDRQTKPIAIMTLPNKMEVDVHDWLIDLQSIQTNYGSMVFLKSDWIQNRTLFLVQRTVKRTSDIHSNK